MTIQCPHCNVSLDGDVNPGDTVECPSCGKGFKVPSAVEIVAAEKKAGERRAAIGCFSLLFLAVLILIGCKIGCSSPKESPASPSVSTTVQPVSKWKKDSTPTLFTCAVQKWETTFQLSKNYERLAIVFAGCDDRDVSKPWTLSAGKRSFSLEMEPNFGSIVTYRVPDNLQTTLIRALDKSSNTVLRVPRTNGTTTDYSFDTHGVPPEILAPRQAP